MKKGSKIKIILIIILIAILVAMISYYVLVVKSESESETEKSEASSSVEYSSTDDLHIDMSNWNYDEDNNVYWQIGIVYCSNPATEEYESMGIYVPGDYFDSEENEDGTYTCTINEDAEIGEYTAETAPIVMPINTAGYSAQVAPTSYSYSGLSDYMEAGFIYVYSGARGRNNGDDYAGGAPWGVTDFKAAIRYLRYNSSDLPGDTESIFTFGHSGGGAQSSLIGATGDSEEYYIYLEEIGALMYDDDGIYISDSVAGSMCWCPITSLDYANEAYEWNMGQYSDSGTRSYDTWTSSLSDDLAEAYAEYINELGLVDEDGNTLELEDQGDGIYTSGSYYDYILEVIENSLNNFLEDTEFPYTAGTSTEKADGGFGGSGDSNDREDIDEDMQVDGDAPDGEAPSDMQGEAPDDLENGERPSNIGGGRTDGDIEDGELPDDIDGEMPESAGDMARDESSDTESSEGTTYETASDYIASLNSDEEWVIYDEETNTVQITSIEAFVNHCKSATKDVGAFDDLDREQAENYLFGNSDSDNLHWDSVLANILNENASQYEKFDDYDDSYVDDYAEDIENVDDLGISSIVRQNMYNPMYYLCDYYEGYGTSTVAKYWRIRTGITQGDTALTVETNLALALQNYDDVESVDFETVWNQGHTTAERTGDSTTNFIEWVNECLGGN